MKGIFLGILALFPGYFVFAEDGRKSAEPAPTYADVAYGEFERNTLDFWQAEGQGPRPVLIYIHGGGWVGGDKSRIHDIRKYLNRGISVASINYRLSKTAPLPAPVHDAARAVQFIRYQAGRWNVDSHRIVLTGASAGGCTSLWIACHDDLAEPDSSDPVERESTRVQGVAAVSAQTSIDPEQIEPWIGAKVFHQMIYKAVGERSIDSAMSRYDEYEALYKEFSPVNHLTSDDPPLFLRYSDDLTLPAKDFLHGIHHGVFGVKMKEKSELVGHGNVYLNLGRERDPAYQDADHFIFSILLPGEGRVMQLRPSSVSTEACFRVISWRR